MSELDTLNTLVAGAAGSGGSETSIDGGVGSGADETIDSLALDALAPGGAVDLSPSVLSGSGGTGYSWLFQTSDPLSGGSGGDAGAGVLLLSNDTVGSPSAYDPYSFTLGAQASGFDGGDGGLGINVGNGGNGGRGGDATDNTFNLSAYLSYAGAAGGDQLSFAANGGHGGAGSTVYLSGQPGVLGSGAGGAGGAGGNAATRIEAATIDSSAGLFVSVSATGGDGGGGGLGGAGYANGRGGDGGGASVSVISDVFTAPGNLSLNITAVAGDGGPGGGSGNTKGANGAEGATFLDIEHNTFSVASSSTNVLTLGLAEVQGVSRLVTLNGAAGGNLVFSGNLFLGSGASELDLAVANGGVAVDTVGGTLAINGSAINPLSGFNQYSLDRNDSIVMSAGVSAYLNTDSDTVILESGHVGGTVYNATAGGFVLQFQGFSGLTLAQVQQDAQVVNTTTEITLEGQTLTLVGYTGPIDSTDVQIVPCFLRGTRIATERGEVPVESLAVGDRALTATGALRRIVWIGHRRLDAARHPNPHVVWPVRVAADAFGEGLPHRDLWLSPLHCVAAQGCLIPIDELINDASVARVARDDIEYWHVELESHDVIVAEGLPVESYLDNGNRPSFANGGAFIEAHPDFRPRHWAETCLPLVSEGEPVSRAKAGLHSRLGQVGFALVDDADAHVMCDGKRIDPLRLSASRLAFVLPEGGRDISLASRTFTPAHTPEGSEDVRALGLCVSRLQVDGEIVPLDSEAFAPAHWHAWEGIEGGGEHRWSRGSARLPADARIVIVDLAGAGRYWRRDPVAANADGVRLRLAYASA